MYGLNMTLCPANHIRTLCRVGVVASLLFVTGTQFCFGQMDDRSRPTNAFIEQQRAHFDKSEWDQSIQECSKVLEATPNSQSALLYRGIAYNGKGEYDAAIKDFDKVVELGGGRENAAVWNRADAYSNRSISYRMKGESLKAIDSAYFSLLEKYENPEAHINRGLAYIARHNYERSIWGAFDRAIYIAKPPAYDNKPAQQTATTTGSTPQSGGASAADKQAAIAWSYRGLARMMQGRENPTNKWYFDDAISNQKKAIELDSTLATAYWIKAAAVIGKNADQKNAEELMKAAQEAMADLDKAIELKPGYAEALSDRAFLYSLAGDGEKAAADLEAAIKANPRSPLPRIRRGQIYMKLKKPELALENYESAVELNENDPEAQCGLGYAQLQTKNPEAAVKSFTKAISIDPKLEMAYTGRAEALKKVGKGKEATADLNKVKELHPAPAKKDDKKKPEPLPPRFMVKSKPVSPNKKAELLQSAKEIDRLIEANYAKTNTKPNDPANDYQFVRRIYLDITGTIPTYQQLQKFLASKDQDRRSKLIDELLNSDAYAGHQFNFWADILRYTDNLSNDVRGEPYRQWLKQSFAENKPWDKMVHEILTSEGLVWKNPAAGYFLRDQNMPLDNMNNTVRIFLGTRIGCAQCHDHPFDRWTQKEFYQTAAFTFGTLTATGGWDKRYWDKDPNERLRQEYEAIEQEEEDRRNNSYAFDRIMRVNMMIVNDRPERKIQLPKDYKYKDAKPDDVVEPKSLFGPPADVRPGETPRQAFARWCVSKDNPRFAKTIANRLWKQAFGYGLIEPVDDMMDQTVAENPELMTFLESEMKRLDFDMKEYLRMIYNTATYQRQVCSVEIPVGEPYHFPGPALRRMTAEQVWDSFLTLAVVDPDEYREMPAHLRTDVIGMDLTKVSAEVMMASERKGNEVDGSQGKRQQKYMYKGVLLGRASELRSPAEPNHFLRMFGQSDRELIQQSNTNGSVPQVLFMFNGPITHMLLEPNSTMYNVVMKKKSEAEKVKAMFLTILGREPDKTELEYGVNELKNHGLPGCGNVIWSLVNTREFLFIQ